MSGKAIANPTTNQFEPTATRSQSTAPDTLRRDTHTTTDVDGLDFDATPGADMKIDLTRERFA